VLNYNIGCNKKEDFFNFRNNSATFLDVFERFRLFICSVLALFSLFIVNIAVLLRVHALHCAAIRSNFSMPQKKNSAARCSFFLQVVTSSQQVVGFL
jgi:hypothetical protein